MKSTTPPAEPSAPASKNTMTRLFVSISSLNVGQSFRFMGCVGGTYAIGVIPIQGRRGDTELRIVILLRGYVLTCLIKNRFPDPRNRVHSRIRKYESKDFIGIRIEESFDFAKVVEDRSSIEQSLFGINITEASRGENHLHSLRIHMSPGRSDRRRHVHSLVWQKRSCPFCLYDFTNVGLCYGASDLERDLTCGLVLEELERQSSAVMGYQRLEFEPLLSEFEA